MAALVGSRVIVIVGKIPAAEVVHIAIAIVVYAIDGVVFIPQQIIGQILVSKLYPRIQHTNGHTAVSLLQGPGVVGMDSRQVALPSAGGRRFRIIGLVTSVGGTQRFQQKIGLRIDYPFHLRQALHHRQEVGTFLKMKFVNIFNIKLSTSGR